MFAENRKVLDPLLRETILNGETVVADRYSFSGIAYTAAKNVSTEFACKTEVGLLKPDLVIYLKADPLKTAQRAGTCRFWFSHRKIYEKNVTPSYLKEESRSNDFG